VTRLPESVVRLVERVAAGGVRRVRRVGGGSINEAALVEVGTRALFVKWHRGAPPGFFEAEADGLARLRATGTVAAPEVLGFDDASPVAALAMAYHPPGPITDAAMAAAGRALASLHAARGLPPGLERDNFIGSLPQTNRRAIPSEEAGSWIAFFREARIAPLARGLPTDVRRRVEGLDLEGLLTEPEGGCALLHGDLWGGNLHVTAEGEALFVDPAVYRGHPEVDLAMTRLFGGFSDAFRAAYREVAGPGDRGLDARLDILNLYPLLVHVHLFGGGYLRQVDEVARRYGG